MKKIAKPIKVPFNMIGEDAALVNKARIYLEDKLGTRLSYVQIARVVFKEWLEMPSEEAK
jgi:hypothetical protein